MLLQIWSSLATGAMTMRPARPSAWSTEPVAARGFVCRMSSADESPKAAEHRLKPACSVDAIEEAALARQASRSALPARASRRSSRRTHRRTLRRNGWPGVQVLVTVDWEGSGFDEEDLAAFRQFRDEFPEVPLTHYLNAAYFTRLTPTDVIGAVSTN